jgi:hypothetical protein
MNDRANPSLKHPGAFSASCCIPHSRNIMNSRDITLRTITSLVQYVFLNVALCSTMEVYLRFDERTASIFRVNKQAKHATNRKQESCLAYSSILKMTAVDSSETRENFSHTALRHFTSS